MKTITKTLIILLTAFFGSCNSAPDDENINTIGRLLRIEDEEHETITQYAYSRNNRLKSSETYQDYYLPAKHDHFNYTYNTDGTLSQKEGFLPGNMYMSSLRGAADANITTKYKYNSSGDIESARSEVEYDFEDINYTSQVAYGYPEENKILEMAYIIDPAGNSIITVREYHYNSNNNIEEVISYVNSNAEEKRILSKEEYTYDDQKTPFQPEPRPHSANNILTLRVTAYNYDEAGNQSIAYTSNYSYAYEYNKNGFPQKVTETFPNEMTKTMYYIYKN